MNQDRNGEAVAPASPTTAADPVLSPVSDDLPVITNNGAQINNNGGMLSSYYLISGSLALL